MPRGRHAEAAAKSEPQPVRCQHCTPAPPALLCDGQEVGFVRSTRHLGLEFAAGSGLGPTCADRLGRMRGAWAKLKRQYGKLGCERSVWLLLQLCRALVEPSASFAGELWGVYPLRGQHKQDCDSLEREFLGILKEVAGLRAATSTPIVYRELGVWPLRLRWLLAAARFWNTLCSGPMMYRHLALDAARSAGRKGHCWLRGLQKQLAAVDYAWGTVAGSFPVVDLACLRSKIECHLSLPWQDLDICPRQAPSQKVTLCTYQQYFACPTGCRISVLRLPVKGNVLRSLLRFRSGCHGLPVDAGRWAGGVHVPRHERACPLCAGVPGDELHLVFDCPALQDLRNQYSQLFAVGTMVQFMWQEPQHLVAYYVHKSMQRLRQAVLDGE